MSRSTLVLAPHQDDETIRLAAYIAFAADRGDRMTLLTATDGSATGIGPRLGLTRSQLVRMRDREQAHAWAWLTDGRGETPRTLGLRDGQATASAVLSGVRTVLSALPSNTEVYVATWDPNGRHTVAGDQHVDHVACWEAGRQLAQEGRVVRYGVHPSILAIGGAGTVYEPTELQALRVEGAVGAYTVIGQRSVPTTFSHVLSNRGRSGITA